MLKARNIKWETEGNIQALKSLPTEVEIPEGMFDVEDIHDWLSHEYIFPHDGFELFDTDCDIAAKSVEEKLYDFFINKMQTGETTDIENVRTFDEYLATSNNGIVIDCTDGKQIRLIIQVN